MRVVKLKLDMDDNTRKVAEKRFHAMWHIHNVLVKHAKKQLGKLSRDREYAAWRDEYRLAVTDATRKRELAEFMKARRVELGLTQSCLEHWILPCSKQYRKMVSAHQVQKEADRIYKGVAKVLFSNGRDIRFKRYDEFKTICSKSANGCKFALDKLTITWMGTTIKCKPPKSKGSASYIMQSLQGNIKYCELARAMFNNGWHYYVHVYIDEPPINKLCVSNTANIAGVDPGVSTVAVVSDTSAVLAELAPRAAEYEKRIHKLQQAMDRSRRTSNPGRYNEDGTYKQGSRGKLKQSNTYRKLKCKVQTLYRKKSAYALQSHRELANKLVQDSTNYFIEKMDYAALAKRSKSAPERSDKMSTVKDSAGNAKTVRKFKRKKRFGHSIGARSPSLFVSVLSNKAKQYGGVVITISPTTYKASQYNHDTDECIKVPLSQRFKMISNHAIQRDLYSAFLLQNPNETNKSPDRDVCTNKFRNFVNLHDACIKQMRQNNISMKQCFGF